MKVLAFNGSARKDSNTAILTNIVLEELKKEGIETELIQLAGESINGCRACYKCFEKANKECVNKKDNVNAHIKKMVEAEGMVLSSPVYVANISPGLKALIDRACIVAKANGEMFSRKVGAAVAAVRRCGALQTLGAINHFFMISQMIIPGSSYWNMAIGLEKGDVEGDDEGIRTMKTLGQNMAWLLKKTHG